MTANGDVLGGPPSGTAAPDEVTLLVSHVTPTMGLERCALLLAEHLGASLRVVAVGEDTDLADSVPGGGEVLGGRLRGWARLRTVARLRRWSRARRGVVVAAGIWVAIPLLACRARLPFRVVVWEHSLSAQNIGANPRLRLLHRLAVPLYRRADVVVVVSDDLAAHLRPSLPRVPVVVVPNYVPAVEGSATRRHLTASEATSSSQQPSRTKVLAVGSLTPVKNYDLLLRSMALLPPAFILEIAGDGPLRAHLEALAGELGVASRVVFLGHVEDVDACFRRCDVVAHPAHGETFGLAMFEAAERSRDVLALDYPLARSVVPSLVPGRTTAGDPAGFAAALLELAAAPTDEADREAARRRRRELLDPETITATWRHLFADVRVPRPTGTR